MGNEKLSTILDDDGNIAQGQLNGADDGNALHGMRFFTSFMTNKMMFNSRTWKLTLHPFHAEEHLKRVQAEADAEINAQKLAVAQQQFAEFSADRADVEEKLSAAAQRLEDLLKHLSTPPSTDTNLQLLVDHASKLREDLSFAALETRSTATQLKEESERLTKRTLDQAQLGTAIDDGDGDDDSTDVEMKRAREDDTTMHIDDVDTDQLNSTDSMPSNPVPFASFIPSSILASFQRQSTHREIDDDQSHEAFKERAKYIPLRLSNDERRLLRLLEGALNVSEYTDKVDILSYRSKTARVHAQIKDLCAILCGLTVAQNFRKGQQLIQDRNFEDLCAFFQDCFEIGRRHKIMNPEKMRDSYGKLQYMLMDSAEPEIQELLGFKCVRALSTVHTVLEQRNALHMLDDPLMHVATAEIHSAGRSRAAIQKDIKTKERARDMLAHKYKTPELSEEDILRCLYSISDNNAYLTFNRDPIDRMIEYLKTYFTSSSHDQGRSLAIQGGAGGARLTHNHHRQYTYVLQTLTLWREIAHEMFKLWFMADADMLQERNYYRLQNTGQGLQRVQSAPHVARAMSQILGRCQQRIGSWVGSSVVHLGDANVPNALMFIDKYTQVPRILNPLVLVLDELPNLAKDPALREYLESAFGGFEECRKDILCDFFRHGFDGSGADNSFSAGSCIDGRLTSAWNWCSKIEKKKYYHVFKLAGFVGFDGEFK